jgi:hypothetical protein
MSGPQTPAQQFASALRKLYEAAGSQTYDVLVRQAAAQRPPLRLNAQRLSDWLGGKSVPADPSVVRFLVKYLQPDAARRSGYRVRPLQWWLGLHHVARRQRQSNRGGRPRADDPLWTPTQPGASIDALDLDRQDAVRAALPVDSGAAGPTPTVRQLPSRLRDSPAGWQSLRR